MKQRAVGPTGFMHIDAVLRGGANRRLRRAAPSLVTSSDEIIVHVWVVKLAFGEC